MSEGHFWIQTVTKRSPGWSVCVGIPWSEHTPLFSVFVTPSQTGKKIFPFSYHYFVELLIICLEMNKDSIVVFMLVSSRNSLVETLTLSHPQQVTGLGGGALGGNQLCYCLVAQSCLTLCNPLDCSLPGSSTHGTFSGKNTAVGCHFLLQGIFPTRDGTHVFWVSCTGRQILYHWPTGKAPIRFRWGHEGAGFVMGFVSFFFLNFFHLFLLVGG